MQVLKQTIAEAIGRRDFVAAEAGCAMPWTHALWIEELEEGESSSGLECMPRRIVFLQGEKFRAPDFSTEAERAAHADGVATLMLGEVRGALHRRGRDFVEFRGRHG